MDKPTKAGELTVPAQQRNQSQRESSAEPNVPAFVEMALNELFEFFALEYPVFAKQKQQLESEQDRVRWRAKKLLWAQTIMGHFSQRSNESLSDFIARFTATIRHGQKRCLELYTGGWAPNASAFVNECCTVVPAHRPPARMLPSARLPQNEEMVNTERQKIRDLVGLTRRGANNDPI